MILTDLVTQEREHRRALWAKLLKLGGPQGVSPSELRRLTIYGGAQGIWVDKARTGSLTQESRGVTVGLLHTGKAYADDLAEDGVLYHYPDTKRPTGRDWAEVEATKTAGRLGLPVFVVTNLNPGSAVRDVHLGWVEGWDDDSGLFLITFGDEQPARILEGPEDEESFVLVDRKAPAKREVAAREGQQRFKLRVFQRYGRQCAVCRVNIPEVLDAAHIRPKNKRGSDDPRNGLVLCAIHHRALDAGLFTIEPKTFEIRCKASGPDAKALRIEERTLEHLSRKPHRDAVEWLWRRWSPS